MVFLGLDVAKQKVDCCLLSDERKKPKRHVIEQKASGFESLKSWVESLGVSLEGLPCILEPTGVYSYKLANWLYEHKASVRFVHPTKSRFFARYHEIEGKNDAIDSLMLAKMGKEKLDDLPEWKPISEQYEELTFLFRRLDKVVKTRQTEKNRLEGHDGIKAFEKPDKYTKDAVAFYDGQEASILEEIALLVSADKKLRTDVRLLKTIPGIGAKTAPILAVLFNSREFKSGSQVAKFLGLIPKDNKSGGDQKSSCMSKAGSSVIRAKLYMGACAIFRKKAKNSKLKKFYNQLLERHKSKGCAHGALMHKLAVVAFGVWKSQNPYDDNYEMHKSQHNVSQPSDIEIYVSSKQCDNTGAVADTKSQLNARPEVQETDSLCSECKRARRSSRTRSEEHKQDKDVKAGQAMRAHLDVAVVITENRLNANSVGQEADSPCSERKRARRPSRTRSEEHKQDEDVKAGRAKRAPLEEVALTSKALVLPQVKRGQGALKRRKRAVDD